MARIEERTSALEPLLTTVMPALKKASDEIFDTESRAMCAERVEVSNGAFAGEGMNLEPPMIQ